MGWSKYFERSKRDAELAQEIAHYIEQETEDNIARGMDEHEARSAAMRKFGNASSCREAEYNMNTIRWFDTVVRHVTYGARQLRQNPGFTATAVLSLMLGIGANAAVFQLLNAVRLRSLPVENPHELAELKIEGGNRGFGTSPGRGQFEATNPLWEQIRHHQQAFAGIFAWGSQDFEVGEGSGVRQARGLYASGAMFSTLGVKPWRGRLIEESDDKRGCGSGPVVLSYGYWFREFGGRDSAIGAKLFVNGTPLNVVGITPPDFFGLEVGRSFDIAVPNCIRGAWGDILERRHIWTLNVMGRLQRGWTLEQASAHLRTASAAWFAEVTPPNYDEGSLKDWKQFRLIAQPGGSGVSELRLAYERSLWLLLGITGLVLLIACANLANLLLARAVSREREIAVRLAIGASRKQLIAQFLTESLLLACIGAIFASGLAAFLSRALLKFVSTGDSAIHLDLSADWRIIAFIGLAAALACVLFGVAPAWQAAAGNALGAMKSGGRNMSADRRHVFLQQGLIVCQVAVSLVLVVSAFLFVGSFRNLMQAQTGFNRKGVTFHFLNFSALKPRRESIRPLQAEILEKIRLTPGVEAASTSSIIPLLGGSWVLYTRVPDTAGDKRYEPQFTWVSPGYFRTMHIPMVAGRDISDRDSTSSAKVLVVNEQFVKAILGGGNAIGRRVQSLAEPGFPEATYEVIGVVGNTLHQGLRSAAPPIAYAPQMQHPRFGPGISVVVKSSLPEGQIMTAVRKTVSAWSPAARVEQLSLESAVGERLAREQLLAWLSGFFGVLAIGLAAIGLYGVISHAAARKRNEVSIRLALGAGRVHVLGLFFRRVAALLGAGLVLGLVSAYALARVASSLLFGVTAGDVTTYVWSAAVLAAVGIIATFVPSARASRSNALDSLRAE